MMQGRGGGGGGRAKSAGPPDSDDAEGLGDEAGADRNDLNYGMNGGADPVMSECSCCQPCSGTVLHGLWLNSASQAQHTEHRVLFAALWGGRSCVMHRIGL
jgi:hypothetical protein